MANPSSGRRSRPMLLLILIILVSNFPENSNTQEDWEAALDENEKLALDAIKSLHKQLDDDKDGNINLEESNEFLREELKYERDYEKRQKAFHRNNDNQVTVRELWETWVKSEVHNWTYDQTVEWLDVFVGLPQYKSIFEQNTINGTFLPRLAVNHLQFLSSGLGVKDMIHKQKISLKAQDVVLFGPPKEHTNYVKDAILTSLLVIAIGICWGVYVRYKDSQRELTKILKDMESLATAEKELQDLQNVMEKTKEEHAELSKQIEKSMSHKNFSELELPDDQVREEISRLRSEVEVLRSELQRAEVELQDKCWVPPPALQHWLQLTYELELKTYNRKKQSAERQLRQAKDACDKLKRKRSSLMGAFVSTHGKSIDDVDKAILEAKGSLTEITHELQERMNRWKQIEILANCPIMNNPGLHYLETVLRGYGKAPSYGGPSSVISNSQDDIDDDAASSIYCASAVNKLVGTSTFLTFPVGQHPVANPLPPRRCSYQMSLGNSIVLGGGACLLLDNNNVAKDFKASPSSSVLAATPARSETERCAVAPLCLSSEKNTANGDVADVESSDESVSAPAMTSSHQLAMPRSKSTGNMQNLRNVREHNILRDHSTDEDNMPMEAADIIGGRSDRDKRVTFGMRPEINMNRIIGESKFFGESKLIGESNAMMERKQALMMRNCLIFPSPRQSPILTPKAKKDNDDYDSAAFHSSEKPDLIKLSYPEVKDKGGQEVNGSLTLTLTQEKKQEEEEPKLSPEPITNSDPSPPLTNGTVPLDPATGDARPPAETNGLILKKVRFSGKVRVLRSISRLVAHSSESLRAHAQKHYKVHTADGDKVSKMETGSVDKVNGHDSIIQENSASAEDGNDTAPVLVKKQRSKLFSSFRSKKVVIEKSN